MYTHNLRLLFLTSLVISYSSYGMMKTGLIGNSTPISGVAAESNQSTQKIPLDFLEEGYSIDPELCIGQSGHWVAIAQKENQYAIGILRPYHAIKTAFLSEETLSEKLCSPVKILPTLPPLLVNQGKYAIIWVVQEEKKFPLVINFSKDEIGIFLIDIQLGTEQEPESLLPKIISGSHKHSFILVATEDKKLYVIDAQKKTLKLVPCQESEWLEIDALQVSSNGKFGVALVRDEEYMTQKYLRIDFEKEDFSRVSDPIILQDVDHLGIINKFLLMDNGQLVAHVPNQNKIGHFDPLDNSKEYRALCSTINLDDEKINLCFLGVFIFDDRYVFSPVIIDNRFFIWKYDLQNNIRSNYHLTMIGSFTHCIKKLRKSNSSLILDIGTPSCYSDRHCSLMVRIIPNDSGILALPQNEQEKAIHKIDPSFMLNIDGAGMLFTFTSVKDLVSLEKQKYYCAQEDTILFTNYSEGRVNLFTYRVPTIHKTPFRIEEIRKDDPQNSLNTSISFCSSAIRGLQTVGNFNIKGKGLQPIIYAYQTDVGESIFFNGTPVSFPEANRQVLYSLQESSENLKVISGHCVRIGTKIPFPILMTPENAKVTHISFNPGTARQATDDGKVAVGCFIEVIPSTKLYPVYWIKENQGYRIKVDKKHEGEFTCIDRTGTWAAGKCMIASEDHAIVKNIQTNELIDLGPGKIFYMTWDGSTLCGVKTINTKPFLCTWKKTQENIWEEKILDDSEGLDVSQICIDRQNGGYVIFKKEEVTEFLGVIKYFENLDITQLQLKRTNNSYTLFTGEKINLLCKFHSPGINLQIDQLSFLKNKEGYEVFNKEDLTKPLGIITQTEKLNCKQLQIRFHEGDMFIFEIKPEEQLCQFSYQGKDLQIEHLHFERDRNSYKIFKKDSLFYFWSERLGKVRFEDILQSQSCYFIPDMGESNLKIIPEIKSVNWCDGKDILIQDIEDTSYSIVLKDLSALCNIE